MVTLFPELRWAQRSSATEAEKNKLWITVAVPRLEKFDVETTESTFKFTGKDAEREYEVELDLYAEIDPKLTRKVGTQQHVVVELRKKEPKAEYWPRLTKDTKRRPYVRTDFDKWVDEDEQEDVPDQDPMAGLGDMGGLGGMAGAGGAGGGGFDMAQLQALQEAMGQGGAGGAGGGNFDLSSLGGMGGAGANDADSDEENDEVQSKLGEAQD